MTLNDFFCALQFACQFAWAWGEGPAPGNGITFATGAANPNGGRYGERGVIDIGTGEVLMSNDLFLLLLLLLLLLIHPLLPSLLLLIRACAGELRRVYEMDGHVNAGKPAPFQVT